jgi:YD repeat-containing protein
LSIASITNALDHTVAATYDFNTGSLTSITDAKGNTSFFEYDILGRITKKINPDLTEREAVYDDSSNIVTIFDELDHSIKRCYDGIGRLIRIDWVLSPIEKLTETYTYTYSDKVGTKTDCGGHIYSYEYDSQNRLTRVINPDSSFMEAHYDDIAHTVMISDEDQHKKLYHYDWTGNLLWVKEYTDSIQFYLTQYRYDPSRNLTAFTDANGNTTSYRYDSLFGVTQITYPDSTTETFSYDSVGNVVQKIDAEGITTFTYDALYQLTAIQYADHSLITLEYDMNGNRILMIDPEGQTSHTYDSRNPEQSMGYPIQ